MRKSWIILVLLGMLVASSIFSAPTIITHQGRILDDTGTPSNGQIELTFRFFADQASADILWAEVHSVTVTDGLFSVSLGSITSLDFSTFPVSPDLLYLEIQVGSDIPLTPRTKINSVPLAAVASSLQGNIKIDNGSILSIDSLGDTTYQLTNQNNVRVEKFQYKQQFGPVQKSQQGVTDSSGYIGVSSGNGSDSSSTLVTSILNRNILKQYFETGDVPTEVQILTTTDTAIITLTYDTLAEATLEVTNNGSVFRGSEVTDNGISSSGIGVALKPSGLELIRGIREGGHTIGSGQITSYGLENIVMVDSLSDTLYLLSTTGDEVRRVWNKRKFAGESVIASDYAFESIHSQDSLDNSLLKKVEQGVTTNGAYIVMLDSLADTTDIIEGSGGALGGGRLIIQSADANTGVLPGSVELSDLDSDGTTDIRCDGNIGIGVSVPTNILEVVQGSNTDPIADAWTTYSSRRWKENIQTITGALGKVQLLRGVEYDWKADGKHDIGLIAEEVGAVIPEVVVFEENGIDAKSVDYPRLVALLIEASKEQQVQITTMQEEIENLKAILTKLAGQTSQNGNATYSKK